MMWSQQEKKEEIPRRSNASCVAEDEGGNVASPNNKTTLLTCRTAGLENARRVAIAGTYY